MSNEGTNSKVGRVRKPLRVMGMAQVGNAPQVGDPKTNVSEDWIRYGRSNLYPEFVRALADNCAPLDACVQKMALYIAGDGFEFLDENEQPIEVARKKWEELCGEDGPEALLYATGLDTALMNTHSWEVIYAVGGVPFQVAHMDVCRVRSGKKGSDGKVSTYFFCSNWEKAKTPNYKPIPIPAWGQNNDGKVVLYKRGYKQLRDYYGEPHWMAAMADAEVLARIPVFNRTQIDTGFRPAIHAHLQTNASEDELDDIDENFELQFTGDNGKAYILTVSAVNETLTVNKIERAYEFGDLRRGCFHGTLVHVLAILAVLLRPFLEDLPLCVNGDTCRPALINGKALVHCPLHKRIAAHLRSGRRTTAGRLPVSKRIQVRAHAFDARNHVGPVASLHRSAGIDTPLIQAVVHIAVDTRNEVG